jgi:hypothetical protein
MKRIASLCLKAAPRLALSGPAILAGYAAFATPGTVNPVPAPGHPPGPVFGAICASNYVARCPNLPCVTGTGNQWCFTVVISIGGKPVTVEICLKQPGGSSQFVSNQYSAQRCVSGYASVCLSHFQQCGQWIFYSGPNCTGSIVNTVVGWQAACWSPAPTPLPVPLPFPPPPRTTDLNAVVADDDPSAADPNVAQPVQPVGATAAAGAHGAKPASLGTSATGDSLSTYTVTEDPPSPSRDPITTRPATGYPWPDMTTEPTGEPQ